MKVVNIKKEDADVYIGRPSLFGNPYSHIPGKGQFYVATREKAIELYREWILTQPQLLAELPKLRGKILGCWCAPLPCHGDVLIELSNKFVDTETQ